ncbi:MAG: urea transporter [Brachymonas sp.]|nr:urea transporter [Brachymonas sp.]
MADSNPVLEFIDVVLRGSGQVIFMDNPLTGLLNFVAMFVGAATGGTSYEVAIGSVIGTIASTAMAYIIKANRGALKAGIYGFNGMLVGACLPTFLQANTLMWIFVVVGSMFSTLVIMAVANFLTPYKMPAFTFPFVLVCWLIVAFGYKVGGLNTTGLAPAMLTDFTAQTGTWGFADWINSGLTSMSQVWFVASKWSGIIFIVALAVESLWCAGLSALGAFMAPVIAYLTGANIGDINFGLWGFTAALTAPAVGCVFLQPTTRNILLAIFSIFVTTVFQGAISAILTPVGLPSFTFPFNLAGWLFLFAVMTWDTKSS